MPTDEQLEHLSKFVINRKKSYEYFILYDMVANMQREIDRLKNRQIILLQQQRFSEKNLRRAHFHLSSMLDLSRVDAAQEVINLRVCELSNVTLKIDDNTDAILNLSGDLSELILMLPLLLSGKTQPELDHKKNIELIKMELEEHINKYSNKVLNKYRVTPILRP